MNIFSIALGMLLLAIPQASFAITIGNNCPISILPCNTLNASLWSGIIPAAQQAFAGFVFAMLVFYSFKLLTSVGDQGQQDEVRGAFGHAIFGVVLAGGALFIADAFTVSGTVVNEQLLDIGIIRPVISFMTSLLTVAFVVNIVYQGIRLVLSQDDSQAANARKRLNQGIIGAAVVVLVAEPSSNFLLSLGISGSADSSGISDELAGITQFMTTIFGSLAVIAVIAGGILYTISIDDQMKERAKQAIMGGIIGLVVVFASYALIQFIISL